MEQNDLLSSLLNDPEKLKGALSMASSLLGGDGGGLAPEAAPASAADAPPPSAHASAPPTSGFAAHSQNASGFDPSAELMQRAMPVIAEIARSGQNAVSREKLNLLNAMKPFVAENVGVQIDHGLRLVSLARMARSAIKQVGGQSKNASDGEGTAHV